MEYTGTERRLGMDRRADLDRREMLDFARFGTDSEKREQVSDRRVFAGRRNTDLIPLDMLEQMR
jgi:hypothetical protein